MFDVDGLGLQLDSYANQVHNIGAKRENDDIGACTNAQQYPCDRVILATDAT
jgi:hypothetical protein